METLNNEFFTIRHFNNRKDYITAKYEIHLEIERLEREVAKREVQIKTIKEHIRESKEFSEKMSYEENAQ